MSSLILCLSRFEAYNESESGTNGLFTAQGRYEYTDERAYLFDVDILKLSGTFPGAAGNNSVLEASGGRMFFSDPTGMVICHIMQTGHHSNCFIPG